MHLTFTEGLEQCALILGSSELEGDGRILGPLRSAVVAAAAHGLVLGLLAEQKVDWVNPTPPDCVFWQLDSH